MNIFVKRHRCSVVIGDISVVVVVVVVAVEVRFALGFRIIV